ncbi:hypothetical protein CAPTEDRAFT_197260 [Capitella teleta]|uniref:Uncharacterized protein n=1 Tax=Capitella teleta TaxID=283909 RepID=R7V8D7_CAPTE|nr:hypothetical protein CAPTEDRAFT_197260 [Capitella teleta]|eukprot:ELU14809.1 hypothetical protein CAPTEDRAFT_197260 [Capitella teleta]
MLLTSCLVSNISPAKSLAMIFLVWARHRNHFWCIATPKLHVPMKPKFIKSVSTESVESIAGSVGSMGSMGSMRSIATERGSVEQLYAVVDKSKKKKKQTDEKIEQMYAKPMKKNKNDFSSDEE